MKIDGKREKVCTGHVYRFLRKRNWHFFLFRLFLCSRKSKKNKIGGHGVEMKSQMHKARRRKRVRQRLVMARKSVAFSHSFSQSYSAKSMAESYRRTSRKVNSLLVTRGKWIFEFGCCPKHVPQRIPRIVRAKAKWSGNARESPETRLKCASSRIYNITETAVSA